MAEALWFLLCAVSLFGLLLAYAIEDEGEEPRA